LGREEAEQFQARGLKSISLKKRKEKKRAVRGVNRSNFKIRQATRRGKVEKEEKTKGNFIAGGIAVPQREARGGC